MNGHPVDCVDKKGWSPLLYAHFQNHQDCVLALMEAKTEQVSERHGYCYIMDQCYGVRQGRNINILQSLPGLFLKTHI